MNNTNLSDIGKKVEEEMLENMAKHPELKLKAGSFNISWNRENIIYAPNDCVCPLGMVMLDMTIKNGDYSNIIREKIPEFSTAYFQGFWRGVDDWSVGSLEGEGITGHKDGYLISKKYNLNVKKT